MDKCVDKTAKFCFKLNMAQISELDPCASFQEDESLLQSQIEDSKRVSSKI